MDSCTLDASCFQATGLTIEALSVCRDAGAVINATACPPGHVGCCMQSGVLGTFAECFYAPTTVDAAASACAAVDGGVFVSN